MIAIFIKPSYNIPTKIPLFIYFLVAYLSSKIITIFLNLIAQMMQKRDQSHLQDLYPCHLPHQHHD